MSINLIPQHYRDEFRYERMLGFVFYAGTIWFLVSFAWAVLLLPSYFFLSTQLDVIKASNQETSDSRDKEIARLTKEIGEVNTVLSTVQGLQSTDSSVVDLFGEVMNRTGSGIHYSAITIVRGSGSTNSMQGIAQRRKDLQALKVDMEAHPIFSKVEIPVDTFNQIADIAFSMTLTLK
ncbi:MAG: hypothetical protein AAB343_03190 [Patescibacteria group bacterium]